MNATDIILELIAEQFPWMSTEVIHAAGFDRFPEQSYIIEQSQPSKTACSIIYVRHDLSVGMDWPKQLPRPFSPEITLILQVSDPYVEAVFADSAARQLGMKSITFSLCDPKSINQLVDVLEKWGDTARKISK